MSEQRKHTPGPWEIHNPYEGTGLIPMWCVANDEYHNSTDEDTPCFGAVIEFGSKEDAYLIAAAPQLLEALEAVEWALGDQDDYCPYCLANKADGHKPDCNLAAALAKARGEK